MSRRTEALMGTTVTIDAPAGAPIERAFDWFRAVEQICTRFDPGSELCRLSQRVGEAVPVSTVLFEAVRFALHVADASGGAFDPTIGAVMQQRGFDREHRTGRIVPPLVEPSASATYRDVEVDAERQAITLRRSLLLDLGAVAKGLAVDLAARELASCGNFAIDAGGDLYLAGVNPQGEPWSIGIRHPRQAGAILTSVRVSNEAVCTSGDYERLAATSPARGGGIDPADATRFDRGAHHLIDARTGVSPAAVASATVIAQSTMLADALATAAFVLGVGEGLALLETMDVEGLIVTADLQEHRTTRWRGE